ncbi:tetrapyrrole methyltransferase, partial [Micrococcus luteus]|nr:tetrapyrrole methyltransferase [Micrococcus luteus]
MSASVDRLVAVVEALRDHCPWTAALTHADLAEYLVVLFQVVLHAAVSRAPGAPAETAGFRLDDAADALTAKMIRRNPLVLTPEGGLRPAEELAAVTPEAVELAWERVKAQERAAAGLSSAAPAHGDGGTGPGLDVGDIPARL